MSEEDRDLYVLEIAGRFEAFWLEKGLPVSLFPLEDGKPVPVVGARRTLRDTVRYVCKIHHIHRTHRTGKVVVDESDDFFQAAINAAIRLGMKETVGLILMDPRLLNVEWPEDWTPAKMVEAVNMAVKLISHCNKGNVPPFAVDSLLQTSLCADLFILPD